MKFIKLLIVLFIVFFIQNTFANELSLGEININVKSSVEIDLVSDYQVNASNITVGSKDNLEIISGHSLLLKYKFLNRLNNNIEIDFWFDGLSKEILENMDIFLLEEFISEEDCINKKGELLIENNDSVKIVSNNKLFYLCVIKKLNEKERINFKLDSGINNRYFLFKSGPKVFGKDSLNYNIKSFVDIKNPEVVTEKETDNLQENLEKTTSEKGNLLNPNFQEDASSTLKETTQQQLNTVTDKVDNVKSGITGFVSLGFSQFSIVVFGLLLVIVLALIMTRKKGKFDNIDDLNRL